MRRLPAILMALTACAPSPSPPGTYEGPTTLLLKNVHGLFGGRDLWIRGDGTMVLRSVRPPQAGEAGLQEARYGGKAAVEELRALLRKHDPLVMRIPDRTGIPCEARPALRLRTASGSLASLEKWASQKHEGFDAIYAWLLTQEAAAAKTAPTFVGAYVSVWKPEGIVD